MFVSVCIYMHVTASAYVGQKRTSDQLKLQLPTVDPEIKLRTSGGAEYA